MSEQSDVADVGALRDWCDDRCGWRTTTGCECGLVKATGELIAAAEARGAQAVLAAVEVLHGNSIDPTECMSCQENVYGERVQYPCPTILAARAAAQVAPSRVPSEET